MTDIIKQMEALLPDTGECCEAAVRECIAIVRNVTEEDVEVIAAAIHNAYFAHDWESETDGASRQCMLQAAKAAINAMRGL
jgi:acyl-CoA reductase-like NAD-dependent aldehyde dehydrogenase